jgi:hypothetical protein
MSSGQFVAPHKDFVSPTWDLHKLKGGCVQGVLVRNVACITADDDQAGKFRAKNVPFFLGAFKENVLRHSKGRHCN